MDVGAGGAAEEQQSEQERRDTIGPLARKREEARKTEGVSGEVRPVKAGPQTEADAALMSEFVTEEWEHDERGYIFEERLAAAEAHKKAGNAHFKAGEWGLALRRYQRALYHAGFDEAQMFDLTDKHRADAHATQIPVKLNLVACVLKIREHGLPLRTSFKGSDGVGSVEDEEVAPLDFCAQMIAEVLREAPANAKAHYRNGQLLLERGDLRAAAATLREAEKLQGGGGGGGGGGVREALRRVAEAQREERARERSLYAGTIQQGTPTFVAAEAAEARREAWLRRLRDARGWALAVLLVAVVVCGVDWGEALRIRFEEDPGSYFTP